jgi:hypothetical protein
MNSKELQDLAAHVEHINVANHDVGLAELRGALALLIAHVAEDAPLPAAKPTAKPAAKRHSL